MSIHFFLGIVVSLVVMVNSTESNFVIGLVVGSLASILPDMDHFLFFYVYGRNTNYSRTMRKFIAKLDYSGFSKFAKENHKSNHFILSHNILAPIIGILLGVYSLNLELTYLSIFGFSLASHFLFDIGEDILHSGRINPNWFFRYSKPY